jgi:hypothetical protein
LRLRKGDLDHIVDDVSDGEEVDEEEVERQRVAMEIREDTERTLAVIAAVTEGRRIKAEEAKVTLMTMKRPYEEVDMINELKYRATHTPLLMQMPGETNEELEERQKRQDRQDRCDAKVKGKLQEREDYYLKSEKCHAEFLASEKARGFMYRWLS